MSGLGVRADIACEADVTDSQGYTSHAIATLEIVTTATTETSAVSTSQVARYSGTGRSESDAIREACEHAEAGTEADDRLSAARRTMMLDAIGTSRSRALAPYER